MLPRMSRPLSPERVIPAGLPSMRRDIKIPFLPLLLSVGTRRISFSIPSAVIVPSVGSSTVPVSPDFFEAVMAPVVMSIVPVASMAVLLRVIFDSGASAVKFVPFLMVR